MAAVAGVVALALPGGGARMLLVLGFTLLGPGCALMSVVRVPSPVIRWGLALTASLTAVSLLSAVMVWTRMWHPLALHLLLLVVTVVLAGIGLVRRRREFLADVTDGDPAAEQVAVGLLRSWAPVALLLAAVALWLFSMVGFRAGSIDDYGLTKALGAPFIVAACLAGAAFVVEIIGPARRAPLVAAVVVLVVITRATTSIVLAMPKYPWTYKHVGVVDLFQQSGRVLDAGDIYQQWPTFFTAAGHVSAMAESSSIGLARWSPVFFCLLQVLLVAAATRALTANRRVVLTSAMIFAASLWGETIYFSPQALAYALMLGLVTIVFVWLRSDPNPDPGTRPTRWIAALGRGAPAVPATTRAQRAGAIVAAALVFFAITSAHQLTPFMILAGLLVVGLLGLIRPFWFVLLLAAIAVAYVLLHRGVVSEYQVFTGFDIFSNTGGNATEAWATAGQAFSAVVVRSMALMLWIAGLAVAWAFRRRLGLVVIPLVMGYTPFFFGLAGNYGGELVYRIYAFSLPWCGMLVALLMWTGARARKGTTTAHAPQRSVSTGRRRAAGLVAVGVVTAVLLDAFTLGSLQATDGQLVFGRISRADVRAAEYFYEHAPSGSVLVQATPAFPTRIDAHYRTVNLGRSVDPSLTDEPSLRHLRLDNSRLPAVTEYVDSFEGSARFLVISDNMTAQAEYFGYLPNGSLGALESTLRGSSEWQVFYENSEVVIFQQLSAP